MTKNKFVPKKSRLNTAPKMRKRAYDKKAEGSRVFRQHQRTWDQIELDQVEEEKE